MKNTLDWPAPPPDIPRVFDDRAVALCGVPRPHQHALGAVRCF